MVNDRYDALFSHATGSAYDLKGRVLVPSVARRAVVQHDLALGSSELHIIRVRPAPARWLGDRLVWLGEWLGAGMTPVSLPD
jgi:hypothetical protein